ncbi:MAG: hypothetical protein JJ895_05310 [Balneolaceae bacterium]|nr:hypothetical protein [Balneolaceae bacterium]
MIEIHAYHGWGFDSSFWDNLKSELPSEVRFKAADRGYFDLEIIPEFEADSTIKLILAHSFGLHWAGASTLAQADYLVIFNGFDHFVAKEGIDQKRELKVLNRMITQCERHPKEVLNAFYENCFHPQKHDKKTPEFINKERLLIDLKSLADCELNLSLHDLKVIGFSGKEDLIVPIKRTKAVIEKLGGKNFILIENSGHALPVVNSSECWSFLSSVVPIFGQHAERKESE